MLPIPPLLTYNDLLIFKFGSPVHTGPSDPGFYVRYLLFILFDLMMQSYIKGIDFGMFELPSWYLPLEENIKLWESVPHPFKSLLSNFYIEKDEGRRL